MGEKKEEAEAGDGGGHLFIVTCLPVVIAANGGGFLGFSAWMGAIPNPQAEEGARHHLAQLRDAGLLASRWGPGATGAALTKRSRAGAEAASSWPIPGG